jgi:hypothetical protein
MKTSILKIPDGVDLFIDRYGELIQASQVERNQLRLAINTHLERIEPDIDKRKVD